MANLRKWKNHLKEIINDTWLGEDSDHPDCPSCGNTMEFYGHDDDGDFAYGDGYWECSSCGFKITENEL